MVAICTIESAIISKEISPNVLEPGTYALELDVDMKEAQATGDAKGFVKHQIALALSQCVRQTGVPLNVGMWRVRFTPFAVSLLGFPEELIA